MSEKATALGAMRQLFLQVNPSPSTTPVGVWLYPDEQSSIDTSTLPVVIMSELVNAPNVWERGTHNDVSRDIWSIEAMVFLYNGPLTRDSQAADAEKLHGPWPQAVAECLNKNQRLFNKVFQVGVKGSPKLFDYRVGQTNWWGKIFWGVRFIFPIVQSVSH